MTPTFLIFSIALNGYQTLYKQNLDSHQRYATRLGVPYIKVTRPFISKLGVECCWLKLCLIQEALKQGYDAVLFLDADTLIMPDSPDIRINFETNKYLYMSKGYTNRFNSGVMLVQQHPKVLKYLQQVIDNRFTTIPTEDSVGWGENGHLIHFAKQTNIVGTLDHKWNNTYDACCNDYIRHYNFGPMRRSLLRNLLHKLLSMTSRQINKTAEFVLKGNYESWQQALLIKEKKEVLKHYPEFNGHSKQPAFNQKTPIKLEGKQV